MHLRFDFVEHLRQQRIWSEKTFGPGDRSKGIIQHIGKELEELRAQPQDLEEWIDVIILALDAAWRIGASPEEIIGKLVEKTKKNHSRRWPDWRTKSKNEAIEHVRDE